MTATLFRQLPSNSIRRSPALAMRRGEKTAWGAPSGRRRRSMPCWVTYSRKVLPLNAPNADFDAA